MARFQRGEREQFWRKQIAEQQQSGLSIPAFCQERGLSDGLFYRWRRKLTPSQRNLSQEKTEHDLETSATARFVPIELPSPPAVSQFEIVRPDGQRVLIPHGFEAAQLRELLRILEELSC